MVIYCMARQNEIAESRGEAFDLIFDGRAHIPRRTVRDVAVGPGGMLSGGSARGIKEARLHEDRIRPFRVPVLPGQPFACTNFF